MQLQGLIWKAKKLWSAKSEPSPLHGHTMLGVYFLIHFWNKAVCRWEETWRNTFFIFSCCNKKMCFFLATWKSPRITLRFEQGKHFKRPSSPHVSAFLADSGQLHYTTKEAILASRFEAWLARESCNVQCQHWFHRQTLSATPTAMQQGNWIQKCLCS